MAPLFRIIEPQPMTEQERLESADNARLTVCECALAIVGLGAFYALIFSLVSGGML
jgi:hypothetical protein